MDWLDDDMDFILKKKKNNQAKLKFKNYKRSLTYYPYNILDHKNLVAQSL